MPLHTHSAHCNLAIERARQAQLRCAHCLRNQEDSRRSRKRVSPPGPPHATGQANPAHADVPVPNRAPRCRARRLRHHAPPFAHHEERARLPGLQTTGSCRIHFAHSRSTFRRRFTIWRAEPNCFSNCGSIGVMRKLCGASLTKNFSTSASFSRAMISPGGSRRSNRRSGCARARASQVLPSL